MSSHIKLVYMFALMVSSFSTSRVLGHGTPIRVDVVDNRLSVSGGLVDEEGYAPMIFVEDDEDGDPFGQVTLPGFGSSTIWQLPGYEIFGMAENSGLSLQVMARPVATSDPVSYRTLWYWSSASEKVQVAPAANPFNIRKSTSQNVTLTGADSVAPAALRIAAPLSSDMGFHNHLVAYALSNATPAPAGAYGFFAQLTSNLYEASDPFLLVFNNGVFEYPKMVPAAIAINAAAFLPGDYNHNGSVDAPDYVVWRRSLDSTTNLAADGSGNRIVDGADYQVWRKNFGTSESSQMFVSSVPEPKSAGLLLLIASWCLVARQRCQLSYSEKFTYFASGTEFSRLRTASL